MICLREHEIEVDWVPFIELKGPISVTLNRDEFGAFILEDPDQNSCSNITNSTSELLYCPPPPENCYNMWDLDRLNYTTWFYEDGS